MKRLLTLLCAVLIAAVAAEVSYGTGITSQPPASTTLAEHLPSVTTKGIAPEERQLGQWEGVALGRPLFAPDCKPAPSSVAGDGRLPRLTGIIALPLDAIAIFQLPGNVKPVMVRHGWRLGGDDDR